MIQKIKLGCENSFCQKKSVESRRKAEEELEKSDT